MPGEFRFNDALDVQPLHDRGLAADVLHQLGGGVARDPAGMGSPVDAVKTSEIAPVLDPGRRGASSCDHTFENHLYRPFVSTLADL